MSDDQSKSDKFIRKVRSFVRREGRFTTAQKSALERLMPTWGLYLEKGLYDWDKVFERNAKVVFEIGFGNGDALLQCAQREPETNFIGDEVHRPGVGRLLHNAEEAGLTNLRVFTDDAVEVLKSCVTDQSLDEVRIYFPDPWHKKKHNKRRIIQPEFISLLCKKLKPSGRIHLATDWEHYSEQMMEVLSAEPLLSNIAGANAFHPRPESRPQTHFETRGQKLGHGVWDLIFELK